MPFSESAESAGPRDPGGPEQPSEIDVAVLGPVEIRGAAQPFHRSAARELVVYLAFHRQGVRSDVWAAALWTDRSVAQSTLHSTSSVARRSLGRSESGVDHLPRRGRLLRLEATVGTDVERFARAAATPDPRRWKEALHLVRGRAFDGLGLCDWAVLDGTQAQIESMVVDTALKAAAHYLRRGQGEEAEWVIRKGLRVSPYDERLYRALLRATEVMGNRVGLRTTMEEILRVAVDGDPLCRSAGPGTPGESGHSFLHPQTVALFRELARGGIPAPEGDPSRL
jgi:DNA-binding SARP family transcriptional activator